MFLVWIESIFFSASPISDFVIGPACIDFFQPSMNQFTYAALCAVSSSKGNSSTDLLLSPWRLHAPCLQPVATFLSCVSPLKPHPFPKWLVVQVLRTHPIASFVPSAKTPWACSTLIFSCTKVTWILRCRDVPSSSWLCELTNYLHPIEYKSCSFSIIRQPQSTVMLSTQLW